MRTAVKGKGLRVKGGGWSALTLLFTLHPLLLTLITLLAPSPSTAASGATFLTLGGGAEPVALGNAYTAVGGDVDSLYYNPAGLAGFSGNQVSFTHSEWLEDSRFDILSIAQGTHYGTWAASAFGLDSGTQEGRDAARVQTANFNANDVSGLLSYSVKAGSYAGLGGSVKYVRSSIDTANAATVAGDAGVLVRVPGQRLWLGGSVRNIGQGLRFMDQRDSLPLTIAAGAAYQVLTPLNVMLDFTNEPNDARLMIHAGAAYALSVFDFRLGYEGTLRGPSDDGVSALEHIRGGVGVRMGRYRADYALVTFGDLGLTHRFTFSARFGAAAADEHLYLHHTAAIEKETRDSTRDLLSML
jgi:hypothetical protein